MRGFGRDRSVRALERRLREERPAPSRALLAAFDRAPARRPGRQVGYAAGLTAALLVALASVGGASYAANAVTHAVKVAAKAVTPATSSQPITIKGISAGGDQYQPGFGFGDPNHEHSGPPGLEKKGGEKAPPAQAKTTADGKKVVSTSITVDEQAALYFSVLDADGNRLVLNQQGTKIGNGKVTGKQVKSLHYVVLVPRTLPVSLQIPKGVLTAGQTYRLHVIAVDAEGNKSDTDIPFTA